MGTRLTTIRYPEKTDEQLDDLAGPFGDKTKAIVVAIDRLHNREIKRGFTMPEKIMWCSHHITVLEAVAREVDYYPSAAIIFALDGIKREVPSGAVELFEYDITFGVSNYLTNRIGELQARLLSKPQPELSDPDPAFEIVRHIRNRWYGKKECDAYPNEIAEQIMARHPYPFYLP